MVTLMQITALSGCDSAYTDTTSVFSVENSRAAPFPTRRSVLDQKLLRSQVLTTGHMDPSVSQVSKFISVWPPFAVMQITALSGSDSAQADSTSVFSVTNSRAAPFPTRRSVLDQKLLRSQVLRGFGATNSESDFWKTWHHSGSGMRATHLAGLG
jgi:hypothetical protein